MVGPRQPRLHDDGFLRFLRGKPCCICNRSAPSEAAHIRMTRLDIDKPITGMGRKPDDRHAVPLCSWCHREGPESQHNVGDEAKFWEAYDINPLALAAKLYAEYGGDGGSIRKKKPNKPRKPKSDRAKIKGRGFPNRGSTSGRKFGW